MKKMLMPASLLTTALALASCGGPSTTAAAPTILYTTPTTASFGNADTTQIVVKFSEAMDTLQTQGAYNSASVGIRQAFGEVTYSWSEGNTKLTIIPNAPLTYNIAPALPMNYAYYISTAAKSAAGVNLAAQFNSNFNTYVKHLNETYYSKYSEEYAGQGGGLATVTMLPASPLTRLGDAALLNSTYATWLTFDLAALPADLQKDNILSADLKVTQSGAPVGSPYTQLNIGADKLTIHSLVYGPTVDVASEYLPTNVMASNLDGIIMNGSVLSAVKDDWDNRTPRGHRSQYQLRFANYTDGDTANDYINIFSGDPVNTVNRPKLTLTYLSNN